MAPANTKPPCEELQCGPSLILTDPMKEISRLFADPEDHPMMGVHGGMLHPEEDWQMYNPRGPCAFRRDNFQGVLQAVNVLSSRHRMPAFADKLLSDVPPIKAATTVEYVQQQSWRGLPSPGSTFQSFAEERSWQVSLPQSKGADHKISSAVVKAGPFQAFIQRERRGPGRLLDGRATVRFIPPPRSLAAAEGRNIQAPLQEGQVQQDVLPQFRVETAALPSVMPPGEPQERTLQEWKEQKQPERRSVMYTHHPSQMQTVYPLAHRSVITAVPSSGLITSARLRGVWKPSPAVDSII